MFTKKRIYLDYAAATPLVPEAVSAIQSVLRSSYGNPSAVHHEGQDARALIESSRQSVARAIQVRPEYITFTSGGTEANNLAIFGVIETLRAQGREYHDLHIITTEIEHPSVGEAFSKLKHLGANVEYVAVDETGRINIDHLRQLLTAQTALVSFAYINSEIGTIQPVHQIRKVLSEAEQKFKSKIYSHVDAAQAPLWVNCQFDAVGADVVSFDFAKCGGPKGSGFLVRSRRAVIEPVMFGGGQEAGMRPGTENVIGIVGGAAAFAAAQKNYKQRALSVTAVRDAGIKLLSGIEKNIQLNGATDDERVANNINISIPGIDTEYLTIWLDQHGFAVSTKSACAGAGGGESTVVRVISNDSARARSTLRLTLGPQATVVDIQKLTSEIKRFLRVQRN